MASDEYGGTQPPGPDPALRRLDRFVGTWEVRGRTLDAESDNVSGRLTFEWLPGGFFLEQRGRMNFMGLELESLELIGYDQESGTFPSTVFANIGPQPLPYQWEVEGDELKISVSYGPLDATFTGRFAEDGQTFGGGWRPNPGADETINVPYDIGGRRLA